MWELDCEESWALKNWCFWTVVLEKILESPLDCKEIQPVHPKGDQPWVFFRRTDAKAETPVLWPPHVKSWLIGKDSDAWRDWGQEEKGTTEDEMAGWHHQLNGPAIHGVAKSQTRLSDWTELNWTEGIWILLYVLIGRLSRKRETWFDLGFWTFLPGMVGGWLFFVFSYQENKGYSELKVGMTSLRKTSFHSFKTIYWAFIICPALC